ncbi:MAG: glycosyltransferase family 9 protein [Candidatus Omnitrophota bacterium]
MIQINSIGDVLMSTPAIQSLKDRYGESEIDVLTLKHTGALLANNPSVKRLYRMSLDILGPLKERKYDLCIDLGGTFESVIWTLLSRADFTVGPERMLKRGVFSSGTGKFYDLSVTINEKHITKRCLEIVRSIGCGIPEIREKLFVSEQERSEGEAFLETSGLKGKSFAVLHPGTKWPPKRWPEENFAGLVKMLFDRKNIIPVLVGSPGDINMLKRIQEKSGVKESVLAPNLGLGALASVIDKASVFIGNDSGPSHIAAAMNTPLVVLFGPTDPEASAPISENMKVLHDKISCWPCTLYYRRDRCEKESNICLQNIKPKDVLKSVKQVLE